MIEEWLVDRKRIPSDWRKRLAAVRAKVSAAFSSLPKDIDPYFQTLDPEGYFFSLNLAPCLTLFKFASWVARICNGFLLCRPFMVCLRVCHW